jgi:plasmid stabilization system protein ParE
MKGLPNWMLGRGFRWQNSGRSLPDAVQSNRLPARVGRFFDIFEYISRDNRDAAERFCNALLNHVDILGTFPHIGVISAQRLNVRSVLHTPVRIYYRIDESREYVEIIHFGHTARRHPTI